MNTQQATPKSRYASARLYLRCHAGSWCKAFDMAVRNDDDSAIGMLDAAKRAFDDRCHRDPLRIGKRRLVRILRERAQ